MHDLWSRFLTFSGVFATTLYRMRRKKRDTMRISYLLVTLIIVSAAARIRMAAAKDAQARRRETASVPDLKADALHRKNSSCGPDLVDMGFTLWEGSKIARTELTIDMVMQSGAQKEVRGGKMGG